ncbi:mediator of RNA polymerase II transcription subunit 15-like [Palaemon carinicauda]|uniref:mediator of RNA polymerase II transcription subunit 15-like n=1 Tax=Palaemon carinicauda TaxID=392227 RepID=UPI0035B5AB8E
MKPGAAIDSVIDVAKHFLSEFKELSGDRDTEAARHFLESLLPMLLKVGPSLMPIFRMEITACLRKYEQATKQGAEMASHDLKYHIINSEYCPAPSPPKAQPQQQQQQLLMLEPKQLQQLQQLQQQLQQPQQQQPQLVPQLPATFPATFPSIQQQGQPAVTSVTPQQLQLLQQPYLLRSPSTSSIGVPENNTTDLNMSLLMDMQLPGQASTAYTPAKAPPQQSTTTLHTPTSSADF